MKSDINFLLFKIFKPSCPDVLMYLANSFNIKSFNRTVIPISNECVIQIRENSKLHKYVLNQSKLGNLKFKFTDEMELKNEKDLFY